MFVNFNYRLGHCHQCGTGINLNNLHFADGFCSKDCRKTYESHFQIQIMVFKSRMYLYNLLFNPEEAKKMESFITINDLPFKS